MSKDTKAGFFEIISGRAGTGKTYQCLKEIADKMRGEPLGAPLIIIVPEHETYRVERELCRLMPDNGRGFLRAFVVGFRRLAYHVLAYDGVVQEPEISELGRQLIIKRILMENEFKSFGKGARQPEFVSEISSLLAEFKSYGVLDHYRARAAQGNFSTEEEPIRQKLEDMDRLYSLYDKSLENPADGQLLYSDDYRLMEKLLEEIPGSGFFRGAEVWVDGFAFFEPIAVEILRGIMSRGCPLHLTLAGDLDEKSIYSRELTIFQRQRDTCRRLTVRNGAGSLGKPARWTALPENFRFRETRKQPGSEVFELLERNLFSFKPIRENAGRQVDLSDLRMVEAANRRREAELAAADIRRLCRDKGYRYSDIAILTRDLEGYGFLLTRVLRDYEIPGYCDEKISAIDHPLAELLISLLQIFTGTRGGWRFADVFRVLKTGFFQAARDEIDRLENYALEFGIQGKRRWTDPAPWEAYRGRRAGEEVPEEQKSYLAEINDIRDRALKPLIELEKEIKAEADSLTVGKISRIIYNFLIELDVPGTLADWAGEEADKGEQERSRRHERMWTQVTGLLEELKQALGNNALDDDYDRNLKLYRQLLQDGLGRIQFSLVPPGLDYVTISSLDSNSCDNVRAVYILGVNAGLMPRGGETSGFLSREERRQINSALGVSMPNADSDEQPLWERYILYRAFTRMREYLWVSYALMDDSGNALMPSDIISRIIEILPELRGKKLTVDDLGLIQAGDPNEGSGGKERDQAPRLRVWQLVDARQSVIKLAEALREMKSRAALKKGGVNDETGESAKYDPAATIREDEKLWLQVYNSVRKKTDGQLLGKLKAGLFADAKTSLTTRLARRLYLKGSDKNRYLSGSVSSLESFNGCPYQYFAQRGLKLKKREEYGFEVTDKGTLLHSVMENFIGGLLKKTIDIANFDSAQLAGELTDKAAADVRNKILMQDDRMRGLLKRIKTTAQIAIDRLKELADPESGSKFIPCGVELSFGRKEGGVTCDGRSIAAKACQLELEQDISLRLTGIIDRLDVMKDDAGQEYVLVIDYKTGSRKLSLVDLSDGQSLQLITYLMLARSLTGSEENFSLIPAGAFYFHIYNPQIDEGKLALKTLAKNNPEADRNELVYARAKEKQDAALKFEGWSLQSTSESEKGKGSGQEKSAEFFAEACLLAEDRLKRAGREILAGKIDISPYRGVDKNACQYCDYYDMCCFDPKVAGYEVRRPDTREESELESLLLAGKLVKSADENEEGRS